MHNLINYKEKDNPYDAYKVDSEMLSLTLMGLISILFGIFGWIVILFI